MENVKTPVPLYYKIIKHFREQIYNGMLKPGDRLPTEPEIISMFGVSRITARKAMEELTAAGLVVRHRAKGTYVSQDVKAKETLTLSGSIRSIVQESKKFDTEVLEKVIIPATDLTMEHFKLGPGESVCRIKRLRLNGRVPVSFIINYLPEQIGEQITFNELKKLPLLEILNKRFGISVANGEQTIGARNAHEVAQYLGIDALDPVLHMNVIYRSTDGNPVELVDYYYRGDFYEYKVNLLW